MKYVEDIILELSGVNQNGLWIGRKPFELSKFDLKFVDSFAISLIEGKQLTEPQRNVVIKILLRNKSRLSAVYNLDIDSFFSNPPWKNPPRVIDKSKKIYINHDRACVCLKSPYDQTVIDKIKSFGKENPHYLRYQFDSNTKMYIFPLDEKHVKFLATNFDEFEKDSEILEIYEKIKKIESEPEKYIPMICFDGDKYFYKNTHASIPQPSKDELFEVLLEAGKYGISVWDDNIEQMLNQDSFCPMSKRFILHSHLSSPFLVKNDEINNIGLFKKLIDSNDKVLFIINGNHQELPKLISQLKDLNYNADQISVLFRTSNPKFNSVNEFIKEKKINNKVSDNIKFFFVDYAKPITKIILENEINFDIVFLYANEFDYGLISHTTRTFLLNCKNVVSTFDFSMSKIW